MSAAAEIRQYIAVSMNVDAAAIATRASTVHSLVSQHRHMDALRNLGAIGDLITNLAGDLAQEAYNDGATKKAIADALGITPATLRGMERTR